MRTQKNTPTIFRKILILLIICSPFSAYSQWAPLELSSRLFRYQKVVEFPGHCKKELYTKAKLWFRQSNNGGILTQKEEEGVLTGTGSGSFQYIYGLTAIHERLVYTLTIEIKDDKVRYTYSNFWVKAADGSYSQKLEEYNQHPWIRKDKSLRNRAENIKEGILKVLETTSKELESSLNIQVMADNW